MANLALESKWEAAVYQIATTDPVGGGHNGVVNTPPKQLGNRTEWLKKIADEVINARGSYSNLLARLDALLPLEADYQNAMAGAVMEALGAAGLANREMLKDRLVRRQNGVITLSNKGIISGCEVAKSTSANRNLSCAAGQAFAKGKIFPFYGESNGASVPSNNGQASMACYAFLRQNADNTIEFSTTALGEQPPSGSIPLYLVTVPAGNTEATDPYLGSVTLSSVRRVEANYPTYYSTALYGNVSLRYPLPDADYMIKLDVVGMDGSDIQRGLVYAGDRNVNGFKIFYNGVGDNLAIRWEISKPNL
jgi:hypothetical protein